MYIPSKRAAQYTQKSTLSCFCRRLLKLYICGFIVGGVLIESAYCTNTVQCTAPHTTYTLRTQLAALTFLRYCGGGGRIKLRDVSLH